MKAAIYARFSSENQRDESIDAQVRLCRQYAEKCNYIVTKIYSDEAITGKTDQRPQFQQMLADAKINLFDVIIMDKVDRFARDAYDSALHKHYLRKKCGIKIEYASQRIDETPEGRMTEHILEALAQYFSDNLARETMKGLTENALKAWHTGGIPPLGFALEGIPGTRSKRYVINEKEANIIRRVFEIIDAGGTYKDVYLATYDDMILLRGRPLSKNSIHDILRNEKYKGTFVYMKGTKKDHRHSQNNVIRIPNAIPAIISPELFDRIQEKLNARKQADRARNKAKRIYLLSGKVFCGKCGHAMVARTGYSKNKVRHDYFMCGLKNRSKECDAKTIRQDYLNELVLRALKEKIFSEEGKKAVVYHLKEALQEKQRNSDKLIYKLEQERREVQKTIENIVQAITQGFISEHLKEKLHAAEAKIKEIEQELIALKRDVVRKLDRESIEEFMDAQSKKLKKDLPEQKDVIHSFVDKVIVKENITEVYFAIGSVDMLLVAPRGRMQHVNTVELGKIMFLPPLISINIKKEKSLQ